jgi:hypothetical protein
MREFEPFKGLRLEAHGLTAHRLTAHSSQLTALGLWLMAYGSHSLRCADDINMISLNLRISFSYRYAIKRSIEGAFFARIFDGNVS